jgi:hypothetical protein
MQKRSSEDGTEWSLPHGFFKKNLANIGGFVLRCPPSLPQADRSLSDSTTLSKEATSNQSVKIAGVTEPMISDPEWQASLALETKNEESQIAVQSRFLSLSV